jgi:hypothetical protein
VSWQAWVDELREAEIRRQAARADARYVVMEVRPDGVPNDRQAFESLEDALDLRDELRARNAGARVFFGVIDQNDEERGWLDHEDLYELTEVPA